MFLWAALLLFPFAFPSVQAISFSQISIKTYLEVGYVVVFGTFICYLLMISGQRVLRPTVVSMYNYMQPVVATIVNVNIQPFYCCSSYFYRSLACCTFKIEARYLFFSLILRDLCPTICLSLR